MKSLKKICLITFLMLTTVFAFAVEADYELKNIKDEYLGTYIPVDLELRLYQTKLFYNSLRASRHYGKTQPHDVLYLYKDICYSDVGFHDGYAIQRKEFDKYKFISGPGYVFCIDNNGYLYRKISDKSGYSEYAEYVMKIILSSCQEESDIKIKGAYLKISDTEYQINLDGNFFETENAAIWLFNNGHYVLEINGNDGEFYTSKECEDRFGNTKDKLIRNFPGMFTINPEELPDYSKVSKEHLRLFRNLIFARNGYTFKSADLREFFNSCSWYKQNPAFKESEMRKDEKDFISLMQKYEK